MTRIKRLLCHKRTVPASRVGYSAACGQKRGFTPQTCRSCVTAREIPREKSRFRYFSAGFYSTNVSLPRHCSRNPREKLRFRYFSAGFYSANVSLPRHCSRNPREKLRFRYFSAGFSFIELMIVLVIISLGTIMVTPLVSNRIAEGDEQLHFFSALLSEHLALAREEGVPVSITGFKGSANLLKYDGTRVTIPGLRSVQTAEINDERTMGTEYHITVYPDGLCDHFILEAEPISSGADLLFESSPLLMTVSKRAL